MMFLLQVDQCVFITSEAETMWLNPRSRRKNTTVYLTHDCVRLIDGGLSHQTLKSIDADHMSGNLYQIMY